MSSPYYSLRGEWMKMKIVEDGVVFGTLLTVIYAMLQFAVYGISMGLTAIINLIGFAIIAIPVAVFFAYTENKLEYEEAVLTAVAVAVLIGVSELVIGGVYNIVAILTEVVKAFVIGFVTGTSAYTLRERVLG